MKMEFLMSAFCAVYDILPQIYDNFIFIILRTSFDKFNVLVLAFKSWSMMFLCKVPFTLSS